LHNRIVELRIAAEKGDVPTVRAKAVELLQNLDREGELIKNFASAAKHDLDMDN
jgi:hypothetical protein